jgi:hypothetical protein
VKYAVAAAALAAAILSGAAGASAEPVAAPQPSAATTAAQPNGVTTAPRAAATAHKRVAQATELPGNDSSGSRRPRPAWDPPGYPLDRAYIQRLVQQMNVPGDGGG